MGKYVLALLWLLLSTPAMAQGVAGYPESATPIHIQSANAANATLTVTIPASATTINYLTGISCSSNGATAASYVSATLTGVQGGPITFILFAPINTAGGNNLALASNGVVPIRFPWAASAKNTAITFSVPALGTGNTLTTCLLDGFSMPVSQF